MNRFGIWNVQKTMFLCNWRVVWLGCVERRKTRCGRRKREREKEREKFSVRGRSGGGCSHRFAVRQPISRPGLAANLGAADIGVTHSRDTDKRDYF